MTSSIVPAYLQEFYSMLYAAKPNGIVLIGMQCSGKTSVGKALTDIIKPEPMFIDTDNYFAKQHTSITDFITAKETEARQQGFSNPKEYAWRVFREEEERILHAVKEQTRTGVFYVLSAGGGIVANTQTPDIAQSNTKLLRDIGTVFYLTPADDLEQAAMTLASRYEHHHQSATQRPNQGYAQETYDRMFTMLTERDELYRKAAHHTISSGNEMPQAIAHDIVAKIR